MAKLEITDISELLLIEGLLDKHTEGIGFKHHQYYTTHALLKRVHEVLKVALSEPEAEEGGGQ